MQAAGFFSIICRNRPARIQHDDSLACHIIHKEYGLAFIRITTSQKQHITVPDIFVGVSVRINSAVFETLSIACYTGTVVERNIWSTNELKKEASCSKRVFETLIFVQFYSEGLRRPEANLSVFKLPPSCLLYERGKQRQRIFHCQRLEAFFRPNIRAGDGFVCRKHEISPLRSPAR